MIGETLDPILCADRYENDWRPVVSISDWKMDRSLSVPGHEAILNGANAMKRR